MIRNSRSYSELAHYSGHLHPELIGHRPEFDRRIPQVQPTHRTHMPLSTPLDEAFHHMQIIREHRKSNAGYRLVDDDYFAVESFLSKSFKRKASISASDVADALRMEYGTVREIIAQMVDKGKLGVK